MFRIARKIRGSRQAIELLSRGAIECHFSPDIDIPMPEVVRPTARRLRKENG